MDATILSKYAPLGCEQFILFPKSNDTNILYHLFQKL